MKFSVFERNKRVALGETIMQKMDVEAVYEHGTLKLPQALPLHEGQKVSITIHPTDSAVKRLTGLIQWQGSQEDLDYLILSEDNDPVEAA
jgi:predicted DNA-binding antitoxin AbrB/MazE fold protein